MKITMGPFKGIAPKIEPRYLPDTGAQTAENCKLLSGALRSWKSLLAVAADLVAGTKTSMYLYESLFWLAWVNKTVNVCKSPEAGDTYKRLYWTGDGAPKMASYDKIVTGSTVYPNGSWSLGVPAPSTAPTVAVSPQRIDMGDVTTGGFLNQLFSKVKLVSGSVQAVTAFNHSLTSNIAAVHGLSVQGTGFSVLDGGVHTFEVVDATTLKFPSITALNTGTITAITNANPASVTCTAHGLKTGDKVKFTVTGMTALNGYEGLITVVTANTFTIDGVNSTAYGAFVSGTYTLTERTVTLQYPISVTAVSKANPAQLTATAHGVSTGMVVSVQFQSEDSHFYFATKVDANNFTVPIDTTAYAATITATAYLLTGWFILIDETTVEPRTYFYRYKSAFGEAGPPSPASTVIDVVPGQTVTVSALPTTNPAGANITTKEIYRSSVGSATTAAQFVDSVALATTSYVDSIASADLGDVLESLLWDMPPSDLAGLIALPNGSFAGYSGKELCLSVPYQPHAWPIEFRYPVADTIMGIGSYGKSIMIATQGAPYVATLNDAGGVFPPERLENGYACISTKGVVDMGDAVAYPTPFGLMTVGVNGMPLSTGNVLGKDEWQALSPTSLAGYYYGGMYFGFSSTAAFTFNPATGDLATLAGVTPTAGFHDPSDGSLYLMVGGSIYKWDAGASHLASVWKSKPFISERPVNLGCARVRANSYPVTFKLYADGALKLTATVSNAKPFKLPAKYLAYEFTVELSGATGFDVYEVVVAESTRDLR